MATIKFYMDEHVAKAVVNGLRQRGVDVLSAVDAELLGTPDEEHLASTERKPRTLHAGR